MSVLFYILLFTFLGSIASLIGGIILLFKEKFAISIAHYLTSFAAGILLGTAFLDLFPESMDLSEKFGGNIFLWGLVGFLVFFLVERSIHWYHYHSHGHTSKSVKTSTVPLLMISDTVHNFIDGIVMALTFLVSVPLGIITSLAVIAHEIPQEIGDFGVMLHHGIKRKRIVLVNLISALAALIGATLAYFIGSSIEAYLPIFLSMAAGFFIYIAASDLIPEIHHQDKRGVALIQSVLLFAGVLVVYLAVTYLEH